MEVIDGLSGTGKRIAVITTCVPALLGEDIRSMLDGHDVILVDSPGFSGNVEIGYARALAMLEPAVDPESTGVNIDGVCLFDLFSAGNVQEIRRLFALASVPVGTTFAQDRLSRVYRAAPYTIGTNGDFASGVGECLGGTLGFDAIRATFTRVEQVIDTADCTPVLAELGQQEERVVRACDKYLHRYDPPSVAIFAGCSYAVFAAGVLRQYLDAEICCIGSRNAPCDAAFPVVEAGGLSQVQDLIRAHTPDLVIGSSFERSVKGNAAFAGIIPPLRGSIRLSPSPLVGINGTLSFIEHVLNACMDQRN
jgi:nitrogenase molybdenum-iron protein alpha/beta subunit